MNLDSITANIRLRSPWEAADLGFAMVQHNARWIFPAWTLLLFSTALTLWLILPENYQQYTPWIIWWLKPWYDRVLLHILSHQMFDQRLSTADIFSAMPRLFLNTGLLGGLLWRRPSFSRGFNLPIWQLEQLRGKARNDRQNLLHMQSHTHAVWLTVGCSLLEMVVLFSLYALIVMLDPTEGSWNYITSIFTETFDVEAQYWGTIIYISLYTLSIWLVEPLYIAASFSLYLNRRTQLEAWDIELAFRNMGDRLETLVRTPLTVALAALLLLGGNLLSPTPVLAAESASEYLSIERLPPEESTNQINAVMALDELSNMRTIKRWERIHPADEEEDDQKELNIPETLQLLFANITKILLWVAVITLVVLLFVYRKHLLAMLKPLQKKPAAQTIPDILFGMDIRPESLPDDIAGNSRHLWETGQHREALSLLYRGALMHLTRHDAIPLQDSHTEGDILRLTRECIGGGQRIAWLTAVTHAWQEIAYAHRTPPDEKVLPLIEGWQSFDSAQATAQTSRADTGGLQA